MALFNSLMQRVCELTKRPMTALSVYGLEASIAPQSRVLAHDCGMGMFVGQDSRIPHSGP